MRLKNIIAAFISFCFLASVMVTTVSAQPIIEYAVLAATIAQVGFLAHPALKISPEVFAVGQAANDIGIVKVDRSGEIAWERTYNGPGDGEDIPKGIAIDNASNIFVAGDSWGDTWDSVVIKYDQYGTRQWEKVYDGGYSDYIVDTVVGNDGRLSWSGYTWRANEYGEYSYDIVFQILPLDPSGRALTRYYDSGGNPDVAVSINKDPDNNFYVTGISHFPTTGNDISIISWDQVGNLRFVYNKNLGGQEEVRAAAIDGDGVDLRVTGYTYIDGTWKGFVISIDTATGSERYARVYDSDAGYIYTHFEDVAVDGHITYATGRKLLSGGNWDGTTKKIDSNGAVVWSSTYDAGRNDYFWAIASNPRLIAAGASEGAGINFDGLIVAYDTNGNYDNNIATYDNNGNEDQYRIVDIDNGGSAFCGGYTSGAGSSSGLLVKYRIGADTPTGTDVTVTPHPNVTITFDEVTQDGYTTAIPTTITPTLKEGCTAIYPGYIIETTATYTPGITLSLEYDPYNIPPGIREEDLNLFQYEEESASWNWLEPSGGIVDEIGNIISAEVDHFSQLLIMAVTDAVAAIEGMIVKVQSYNIQHGIENSLDAKLQAAQEALEEAMRNANITAINKLQAFINECEAQKGKALTEKQANELINDANAIIEILQ